MLFTGVRSSEQEELYCRVFLLTVKMASQEFIFLFFFPIRIIFCLEMSLIVKDYSLSMPRAHMYVYARYFSHSLFISYIYLLGGA